MKKPYKCDQCDFSATCKILLKSHVKSKHAFDKLLQSDKCDTATAYRSRSKRSVQAKNEREAPSESS